MNRLSQRDQKTMDLLTRPGSSIEPGPDWARDSYWLNHRSRGGHYRSRRLPPSQFYKLLRLGLLQEVGDQTYVASPDAASRLKMLGSPFLMALDGLKQHDTPAPTELRLLVWTSEGHQHDPQD